MDEPKPGKCSSAPHDRRRTVTPTGSVQRGAMAFAEGVFAGIRNPLCSRGRSGALRAGMRLNT